MARAADANDLRCLLSLAGRLRQLARGTLGRSDRALYMLAAEALEKYSTSPAASRPDQRPAPDDPRLYRPVNLTI